MMLAPSRDAPARVSDTLVATDAIEMDSPEISQTAPTVIEPNVQNTPQAYEPSYSSTTSSKLSSATEEASELPRHEMERSHPSLPMGAVAAREPVTSTASSSTVSSFPSASLALQAAHVGRTPPPIYPEYQKWGQKKAVGFKGKTFWMGLQIFNAMEFVGEVFADFLGLYDSKYQYVVDAHDRYKRELAMEKAERAALKREHREELARLAQEQDPHHQAVEENRRAQNAMAQQKEEQAAASSSSSATDPSTALTVPAALDPSRHPDAAMPDV